MVDKSSSGGRLFMGMCSETGSALKRAVFEGGSSGSVAESEGTAGRGVWGAGGITRAARFFAGPLGGGLVCDAAPSSLDAFRI